MTIQEITSAPPKDQKSVLFFWSSWHEATAPQGSTSKLFETLASTTTISPQLSFYRVEAEVQSHLSAAYGVTVVPSFVLLHGERIVDKIEGVDDVARLTQAVGALRNLSDPNGGGGSLLHQQNNQERQGVHHHQQRVESQEELLNKRLKHLTQSSQIMLFMKGSPDAPRCGFSRQAVELLNEANVAYSTFDILSDEDVRQGLKKYSDWPTYPQLYVNGELVGGLDIMKEMKEDGEDLAEQLNVPKIVEKGAAAAAGVLETLEDRLT
jgi:monothiol glutaredoxin, Grx4 family